jgi:phosphoribosylglycinamide formyltransferase-1
MGFLCSSGGSVAASTIRLLRDAGYEVDAAVVTDRPCGAENVAFKMGLRHRRIEYTSRDAFSQAAATWLYDVCRVDWTCLMFLRLVSAQLFGRAPCFNLHPSLLPAFPGLSALKRARQSGSRFFGATAHLVDESVDGGPILAQVISPLTPDLDEEAMGRISFAQKVYLLLVLVERMMEESEQRQALRPPAFGAVPYSASPPLANPVLAHAFKTMVQTEGILWTI